MADIYGFNSQKLDVLLDSEGLEKAWKRILLTHLKNSPKFSYILKDSKFKSTKELNEDFLSGMSIGEISVLYEYSVAKCNSTSRKSNGQFFTPDDVARFMAKFSKDFEEGVWLDPCSGIGNLSWHLVDIQNNPEEFLLNRMILSDKDALALLIARVLLTKSFQNKNENLYFDIEQNFKVYDFLSVADSGKLDLFNSNSDLSSIPKHDFVIVNPPYLATQVDSRFECGRAADLFAYFLENVIKSSRGFISITPQSFTNAGKFSGLRDLLTRNYENLTIFCFDNVPANIFRGIKFGSTNTNQANSIRAAIMVAKEGPGKQRITSLLRWKTSERETLFKDASKFLSEVPLSVEFFPKVARDYAKVYLEFKDSRKLLDIASSKATNFALFVPSAPRYFIPALKSSVKRASQRTLYFKNEKDQNLAYLLINSSFMYWWWRVRDGGMTLSLETLMSCPIPDFEVNLKLVSLLEESEEVNKVFKMNAGESQENVKHPKALMTKLNKVVISDHAELLLELHNNSELASRTKRSKTEKIASL